MLKDFLRNVLALVADIANFYKKKVTNLVKTQFTQDLINTLQRFIYIKDNELMIKYAVHVQNFDFFLSLLFFF